jgi:hypothetical protein
MRVCISDEVTDVGHVASNLQAIFERNSIEKTSPELCYAWVFPQSFRPNLTQILLRMCSSYFLSSPNPDKPEPNKGETREA